MLTCVVASHGTRESFAALAYWTPLREARFFHGYESSARFRTCGKRSATSVVHPRVWALLAGFSVWFALAVWGFAGGGLSDYLLVIVSGFVLIVVALQLILSRVGRTRDPRAQDGEQLSLRDWTALDFETWQDRLSGTQAALHILLPIGIAAVGMTTFGIVFQITQH